METINDYPIIASFIVTNGRLGYTDTADRPIRVIMVDRGADHAHHRYVVAVQVIGDNRWNSGEYLSTLERAVAAFLVRTRRTLDADTRAFKIGLAEATEITDAFAALRPERLLEVRVPDQPAKDLNVKVLDEYRNAVRGSAHADFNAASCGTRTDYRKAHEAEEREEEARTRAEAELLKIAEDREGRCPVSDKIWIVKFAQKWSSLGVTVRVARSEDDAIGIACELIRADARQSVTGQRVSIPHEAIHDSIALEEWAQRAGYGLAIDGDVEWSKPERKPARQRKK